MCVSPAWKPPQGSTVPICHNLAIRSTLPPICSTCIYWTQRTAASCNELTEFDRGMLAQGKDLAASGVGVATDDFALPRCIAFDIGLQQNFGRRTEMLRQQRHGEIGVPFQCGGQKSLMFLADIALCGPQGN